MISSTRALIVTVHFGYPSARACRCRWQIEVAATAADLPSDFSELETVALSFRNDADYSGLLVVGPQLLMQPSEMTAVPNSLQL